MFLNGIAGLVREDCITIRERRTIYSSGTRALDLYLLRTFLRLIRIDVNMAVTFDFTGACAISGEDVIREVQSGNVLVQRGQFRRAAIYVRTNDV